MRVRSLRARRGQSEVVGTILVIPIIISLFIAGSVMLHQNIQHLERVNDRMREHLIVIPLYYNDTLYAKILNVGVRPSMISYIILYNVSGSARQITAIERVERMVAPGSNITLEIATALPKGKYEVNVVTGLGNVFGWDPSIGAVYTIPPEDTVLKENPLVLLSDIIDPELAKYILKNYTVVGYETFLPILYDTDIQARIAGTSNYRILNLSIDMGGIIDHHFYKNKNNGNIIHEYTGEAELSENLSAMIYIYTYLWGYGSPTYSTGIRLKVNYTLAYNGSRPALFVFRLNKLDNVAVPIDSTYKNTIGKITIANGTLLSCYDNKYVILLSGPGAVTVEYMTWRVTPPSSTNGGSWSAQLEGIVSFTRLSIVYLEEK